MTLPAISSEKKWTFIHLSDIHLKSPQADGQTAERENLRHELLEDVRTLREAGQRFDAVLVTGDIAFSGSTDQYAIAREFLVELQEVGGVEPAAVWTIPGNHDIDRQVIRDRAGAEDFRKQIQHLDHQKAQRYLDERLGKVDVDDFLVGPLKNYNDFAGQYNCMTLPNQLAWHTDLDNSVEMNDGSKLQIHGFNSAYACDGNESRGDGLFLGQQQFLGIRRTRGVAHLILCHHPPSWLTDGEIMLQSLRDKAQIVLFGHEHWPRHQKINEMLQLNTGAVHLDGWENESPMYNIVSVWVDTRGEERELVVEVNRRTFLGVGRGSKFAADNEGRAYIEERLRLTPWTPTPPKNKPNSASTASAPPVSEPFGGEIVAHPAHKPPLKKQVVFAYFNLSTTQQLRIALALELMNKALEPLEGAALTHGILQEAEKQQLLEELWIAIQKELSYE